jgi:hypothetical protein
VVQTARVVVVQVRHQQLADVPGGIYAHVRKPHSDLLLRDDSYLYRVLEEGVGLWHEVLARVAGVVSGVDDEESLGVLDQVAIDGLFPNVGLAVVGLAICSGVLLARDWPAATRTFLCPPSW